jgi:hypothetical protein
VARARIKQHSIFAYVEQLDGTLKNNEDESVDVRCGRRRDKYIGLQAEEDTKWGKALVKDSKSLSPRIVVWFS